jgi:hypothetical protein
MCDSSARSAQRFEGVYKGQHNAQGIASGIEPVSWLLCLFQRPTGLADGFGLKEPTLLACSEIHPRYLVPPFRRKRIRPWNPLATTT